MSITTMSIAAIGISHKTAPLAIRERVAIPHHELGKALANFRLHVPGADIMILSTCNRTELYSSCTDRTTLLKWLTQFHGLDTHEICPYLYYHQDLDALTHAMKVCSSLDSMVLGEPQIVGQMKKAFTIASQQGYIGRPLELAFQHIFSAAKAVRSTTNIGHCPVSVAYYAASLSRNNIHCPISQKVVIIGAGATGALLAQHIKSLGCKNITLLNRSYERAQALAEHLNLKTAPWEELPTLLQTADVILAATDSSEYVIDHAMALQASQKRHKTTPLLLIDVANPRNIDPLVATLPQFWIRNLDDLHVQIDKNTQRRQSTVSHAEKIIAQYQQEYVNTLRSQHSVIAIKNMREKTESLKKQELLLSLKQLQQGKPAEEVLERLANRLTQKWLHQPCVNLREASVQGETQMLDTALALFNESKS